MSLTNQEELKSSHVGIQELITGKPPRPRIAGGWQRRYLHGDGGNVSRKL